MASHFAVITFFLGMLATKSMASYPDALPRNGNLGNGNGNLINEPVIDPLEALAQSIPGGGVPGEDYTILSSVPDTGFTCDERLPGYYADTAEEAGCQVFRICQDGGRVDAFLCPNGTVFNQQFFVCDWWFNFDCASAEEFFGLNGEIGKVDSEDDETNEETNGYGNNNGYGSKDAAPSTSYGSPSDSSFEAPSSSYGAPAPENGNRNGFGTQNNVQKPSGLYETPV